MGMVKLLHQSHNMPQSPLKLHVLVWMVDRRRRVGQLKEGVTLKNMSVHWLKLAYDIQASTDPSRGALQANKSPAKKPTEGLGQLPGEIEARRTARRVISTAPDGGASTSEWRVRMAGIKKAAKPCGTASPILVKRARQAVVR